MTAEDSAVPGYESLVRQYMAMLIRQVRTTHSIPSHLRVLNREGWRSIQLPDSGADDQFAMLAARRAIEQVDGTAVLYAAAGSDDNAQTPLRTMLLIFETRQGYQLMLAAHCRFNAQGEPDRVDDTVQVLSGSGRRYFFTPTPP